MDEEIPAGQNNVPRPSQEILKQPKKPDFAVHLSVKAATAMATDGILGAVRVLAEAQEEGVYRIPADFNVRSIWGALFGGKGIAGFNFINDPGLIEEALRNRNQDLGRGKSPLAEDLPAIFGDSSILVHSAENKAFWKKLRKPFESAYSRKETSHKVPALIELMEARIASWPANGAVDVKSEMLGYAFDSVMKPAIGDDPNTTAVLQKNWQILTTKGSERILRLTKGNMAEKDPVLHRALMEVNTELMALVQREKGKPSPDYSDPNCSFIAKLVHMSPPDRLSDEAIRDELKTTLFAGMETMGSALAFLWYELGQNEGVQQKVEDEITEMLAGKGPNDPVDLTDLDTLKYCKQVIDEVLRVHPIVWGIQRSVLQDTNLGGYLLNKGDIAAISVLELHRNKKIWQPNNQYTDPDTFDPSRFDPEKLTKEQEKFHIPFGTLGEHACPARPRAEIEMLTSLVAMARQKYRLKFVSQKRPKTVVGVTIGPQDLKMYGAKRINEPSS